MLISSTLYTFLTILLLFFIAGDIAGSATVSGECTGSASRTARRRQAAVGSRKAEAKVSPDSSLITETFHYYRPHKQVNNIYICCLISSQVILTQIKLTSTFIKLLTQTLKQLVNGIKDFDETIYVFLSPSGIVYLARTSN